MLIPENLFYTKAHLWVKKVEDGLLIGITDFAQENLGEIQYLDLPQVGEKLIKGESYGTAETSKSVSDLFAPIDATVAEVNLQLSDAPEVINDSPYEEGWMLSLTDYKDSDLEALLDARAYADFIA
jgi:glycine cleavage system H protein